MTKGASKTCLVCGNALKGRQTKYCSHDCYRIATSQQIRERHANNVPPSRAKKKISPNRRDITGMKFGELTAVRRTTQDRWIFLCSCGKSVEFPASRVVYGSQKSCGHLRESPTGATGVKAWHSRNGMGYRAYIVCDKTELGLGVYETVREASIARNAAEIVWKHVKQQKLDRERERQIQKSVSEIEKRRLMLGLSRPRLAEIVGTTRESIAYWEQNNKVPRNHELLQKLASALNCDPALLAPKKADVSVARHPNVLKGDKNAILVRRKAAGLSRKQLSEMLGVSRASIYSWENYGTIPRAPLLKRLAEILNCQPLDLLPISDTPHEETPSD